MFRGRAVRVCVRAFVLCAVALTWSWRTDVRAQAPYSPTLYSGLSWRMLGPFRGGRVDAVSGVPGRPHEFYFGAVNGGVWKTIDGGRVWRPIFDSQPVASIGALAVAPSAPDTIYVGTGESTLRDSMGFGNGMYKSIDAGRTWTHIGLDDTQHIGKIAVDPRNANVVFVAAIGHLYEAHPDRGVFRSEDGGKSWKKVLFKNDSVGAVDVVIDPTNSRIVYASLWNTRRPPWYTYQPTNGPGGGIFKSTDGGTTWSQLTNGLPTACVGRTGIAVAPSNPRRLYAVVDDFLPEGAPPDSPCPGSPRVAAQVRQRAQPVRGEVAEQARARPPHRKHRRRSPGRAASIDRTTPVRRGRSCRATALCGVAAGISSTSIVDPKQRGHRLRAERVALSIEGRRQDVGAAARVARRRRLSPAVDLAGRSEHDDLRERSGRGHHAQRDGGRSERRDLELVAQSADRADLSPVGGLPIPVLGDRRAAGQRRRRRALARASSPNITMRDWEPIGAGGESGMTAGDPLHPGIIFGGDGTRFDLETNLPLPTDQHRSARSRRERTGRSRWCSRRPTRTRSTTRTSSSSRRPTARRPGRRSARI